MDDDAKIRLIADYLGDGLWLPPEIRDHYRGEANILRIYLVTLILSGVRIGIALEHAHHVAAEQLVALMRALSAHDEYSEQVARVIAALVANGDIPFVMPH